MTIKSSYLRQSLKLSSPYLGWSRHATHGRSARSLTAECRLRRQKRHSEIVAPGVSPPTADLLLKFAPKRYLRYSNSMNTVSETIGCVDSATNILGNKWTPQLLRYFLNEETVRFCQIQDLVGGINPRTLCARLEQLEQQGIIVKQPAATGSRSTYTLTDKGRDLMPVLQSMENWSSKYPAAATV